MIGATAIERIALHVIAHGKVIAGLRTIRLGKVDVKPSQCWRGWFTSMRYPTRRIRGIQLYSFRPVDDEGGPITQTVCRRLGLPDMGLCVLDGSRNHYPEQKAEGASL